MAEAHAWLRDKMEDLTPSSRWRYWLEVFELAAEYLPRLQKDAVKYAKVAAEDPADRNARAAARFPQRLAENTEAEKAEAFEHLERLRMIIEEGGGVVVGITPASRHVD